MAQNWVELQHGMSSSEFIRTYASEAKCEAALERARGPEGFVCPHCGGREHSRFFADGLGRGGPTVGLGDFHQAAERRPGVGAVAGEEVTLAADDTGGG